MAFSPDSLVAVVDDDPMIVESISDLLASVGHATLCFATATALLECPYLDAIACLISDIRMPAINGWQLAAILQQRRPGLQVVLMTAHDPAECGMQGVPPDSIRILRKPFEAQQLLSVVERAIRPRP